LSAADLQELPGSEVQKVAIAAVIWQNMIMKMPWIAECLSMKSAANVSQQFRRYRTDPQPIPRAVKTWVIQSTNVAEPRFYFEHKI